IKELHAAGVPIVSNANKFGIPQGTPISAVLSNLYMVDLDTAMALACAKVGALYQRYSDDILIICDLANEESLTTTLKRAIKEHKLEIKDEKTERAVFSPGGKDTFQYLGFNLSCNGAVIRPSSLARQWRKAKHAIRRTRRIGEAEIAAGH